MNVKKTIEGDTLRIAVSGRLDSSTSQEVENIIADEPEEIRNLVFDFAELEYISSAGLRVLLTAQASVEERGNMKVIHVNEVVREVFEVTGLSDILDIE